MRGLVKCDGCGSVFADGASTLEVVVDGRQSDFCDGCRMKLAVALPTESAEGAANIFGVRSYSVIAERRTAKLRDEELESFRELFAASKTGKLPLDAAKQLVAAQAPEPGPTDIPDPPF